MDVFVSLDGACTMGVNHCSVWKMDSFPLSFVCDVFCKTERIVGRKEKEIILTFDIVIKAGVLLYRVMFPLCWFTVRFFLNLFQLI